MTPEETRARFNHLENVAVNDTEAGASAKVFHFPADRRKTIIPLPPELAKLAKKGMVDVVTLVGDSLEGIGLFDGDQVICKTAFSKKEIKAHSICIVYVQPLNDTFAKRVIFKDSHVILRSFNPNIEDMIYSPDEIEIQGIVLNLLLGQDAAGRFQRAPELKPISRSERSNRIAQAMQMFIEPEEEPPF